MQLPVLNPFKYQQARYKESIAFNVYNVPAIMNFVDVWHRYFTDHIMFVLRTPYFYSPVRAMMPHTVHIMRQTPTDPDVL